MDIKKTVKQLAIRIFYMLPIDKKKVVFSNFKGRGYGCNPKYIAEELHQDSKDWKLIWVVDKNAGVFPEWIQTVPLRSIQYYYALITSGFWVFNSRNNMHIRKRKGQIYIQTWHAPFSPKLLEADAIDRLPKEYVVDAQNDGAMTDAILADSKLQEEQNYRSFWLNENAKILRFGLPRNDYLINNKDNKSEILACRTKIGISIDNFVVLYAPTFRDDYSLKGYVTNFAEIAEAFQKKVNKRVTILVRMHPNVRTQVDTFENLGNIKDVSLYPDIQELSLASDCIISDYSTSIFDFTLMGKAAFICALDIAEYQKMRGLLPIFFEMPYPISYSTEELINDISTFNAEIYNNRIEEFLTCYPVYDDGKASASVVSWMKEMMDAQ